MFMHRRPPLSHLERLEQEGNDDFHLLAELGPEHFSAEHLAELRGAARERLELFDRRQRLAMLIGGTAAGWVFLGILTGYFGPAWLSVAAIVLAGISFFAFFGVILWQKHRFESRGELEHTLLMIEEELRRRASKKMA